MSDVLRRQKDQIKKMTSSYLSATTSSQYLRYFEGSPTYVNYYRQNKDESTRDIGLEAVNSFIGNNSPKKYDKIYDLQVWGVDALDVANSLMERGLLTGSNGEFLLLPNTVIPCPGDYFIFNYEGLTQHLFVVNDAQFDKLSNPKFYRCSFSLVNFNADTIEENVNKEYTLEYNGTGADTTATLEEVSETANKEAIKDLVDKIIERYTKLFYDEDMDTFLFKSNDGSDYWSPYLQHFLHDSKVLSKYKNDLLTEIYIMDITETDNPRVFNEEVYRNSIFRNIEVQNSLLTFDENFLGISDYNLKMERTLPFFMSPIKYKLVHPIYKRGDADLTAYLDAFPLFFGSPEKLFKDVPHEYKVHKLDDLHIARLDGILKNGDILYECNRHELEPTKICIAETVTENNEEFLEIKDISIEKLFKKNDDNDICKLKNYELIKIIKEYLNGTYKTTEDTLDTLNKYFYENSLEIYILIPLVLYILKDSLS